MTAAAAAQALLPWLADWSRRHTFGPVYGPQARWQGAAEVVAATGDGLLMLWPLWSRREDQPWRLPVAAALPIICREAFNLVLQLSSTSPHTNPGARSSWRVSLRPW